MQRYNTGILARNYVIQLHSTIPVVIRVLAIYIIRVHIKHESAHIGTSMHTDYRGA